MSQKKCSLILKIVRTHKWDAVCRIMVEKRIKVKGYGNLAIFNYSPDCDFSDPVVCEARGIIIDRAENRIVARGFDKFFNFSENYAAPIDWKTAVVQEKIDGSIVKLYFYNGEWRWATNSMILAEHAETVPGLPVKNYMDIIRHAENYDLVRSMLPALDPCKTYIFELTSPYNKVVVSQEQTMLHHIGTRNNVTGEETDEDIGIRKPKEYPLHTLSDCITAAAELNQGKERVVAEGFVVVDQYFNRIKIKSPEYVYLHRTVNNHVLSGKRIFELLTNEDFNQEGFLKEFPEYKGAFDWYRSEIARIKNECIHAMERARTMYREGTERKQIWDTFKDLYGFAAMQAVGNDRPYEQLWQRIQPGKIFSLIRPMPSGT